ncbi:unnamed protein product [Lymnaea stagnalis]|uniref:Uncharacterized protein n=1 Tax=Lymnaea stagnalis TaxID=6523 RepID=A0AAV2HVT1_LYMST
MEDDDFLKFNSSNQPKSMRRCSKRMYHRNFFPAHSFSINNLPEDRRDENLHGLILLMAELTGLIEVETTSNDKGTGSIQRSIDKGTGFIQRSIDKGTGSIQRSNDKGNGSIQRSNDKGTGSIQRSNDKGNGSIQRSNDKGTGSIQRSNDKGTGSIQRSNDKGTGSIQSSNDKGTGFIQRIRLEHGICPCHECKDESRKFAILTVSTVVHMFSDIELDHHNRYKINWNPKCVTMTLKYNYKNKYGTKKIYGWKLLENDKDIDERMDWCCIEFVTHDLELVEELDRYVNKYQEKQATVYNKYKDEKDVNLVVVVGHPHGGIKKVSIGKKWVTFQGGKKWGTFQGLKELRDTQRWGSYNYTTPTCPGSSGSPILILGQPICGFGYWFGHPHNHAGFDKDKQIPNTELFNTSSIGAEYVVAN